MTLTNCLSIATLDPTKSFTNAEPRHLCEALGVLPYWVDDWKRVTREPSDSGSGYEDDLKTFLQDAYGFPLIEIEGGTVAEDGVYQSRYKDDSPLPPLAVIPTTLGNYYQYDYAIVAIPTSTGYFVTRMD
jgi:hypothetical protein